MDRTLSVATDPLSHKDVNQPPRKMLNHSQSSLVVIPEERIGTEAVLLKQTLFGEALAFAELAPELLITIFGFLPFDDLKNATLVCRFVIIFFGWFIAYQKTFEILMNMTHMEE